MNLINKFKTQIKEPYINNKEIRSICDLIKKNMDYPNRLFLYGDPGTGKTITACYISSLIMGIDIQTIMDSDNRKAIENSIFYVQGTLGVNKELITNLERFVNMTHKKSQKKVCVIINEYSLLGAKDIKLLLSVLDTDGKEKITWVFTSMDKGHDKIPNNLNSALLSRLHLIKMNKLNSEDTEKFVKYYNSITKQNITYNEKLSNHTARDVLNLIEKRNITCDDTYEEDEYLSYADKRENIITDIKKWILQNTDKLKIHEYYYIMKILDSSYDKYSILTVVSMMRPFGYSKVVDL